MNVWSFAFLKVFFFGEGASFFPRFVYRMLFVNSSKGRLPSWWRHLERCPPRGVYRSLRQPGNIDNHINNSQPSSPRRAATSLQDFDRSCLREGKVHIALPLLTPFGCDGGLKNGSLITVTRSEGATWWRRFLFCFVPVSYLTTVQRKWIQIASLCVRLKTSEYFESSPHSHSSVFFPSARCCFQCLLTVNETWYSKKRRSTWSLHWLLQERRTKKNIHDEQAVQCIAWREQPEQKKTHTLHTVLCWNRNQAKKIREHNEKTNWIYENGKCVPSNSRILPFFYTHACTHSHRATLVSGKRDENTKRQPKGNQFPPKKRGMANFSALLGRCLQAKLLWKLR